MKSKIFVGCCNRALPYFPHANGGGIRSFELDEEQGTLTPIAEMGGIDNPSFLVLTSDGSKLLATTEMLDWQEGTVTVYAVADGRLTYVNKQAARGDITAHLAVDRTDRFATCCNYSIATAEARPNASVALFQLQPDGELSPAIQDIKLQGSGTDPERQERSHAHCSVFTANNLFALVADLGSDRIEVFRFDATTGWLAHFSQIPLPRGSGPRHIALHPKLAVIYCSNELSGSVATISFDEDTGLGKCIAVTPTSTARQNHCSAIKISPDGRHLYVGNRGEDTITLFGIDQVSGHIEFMEATASGGQTPRDFAFSATGKCVVVANQDSDLVCLFRRDPQTGLLKRFGQNLRTGSPMCIAFEPQD